MIKALFVDVDGTLLGPSGEVSERTCQRICDARDAGCEVIVATGRTYMTARPILERLQCTGWVVLGNGSIILHLSTGEVIRRHLLTRAEALASNRVVWNLGLSPLAFEEGMTNNRILFHPDRRPLFHNPERYREHSAILTDLPFDPLCVCLYGHELEVFPKMDALRAALPASVQLIEGGGGGMWGGDIYSSLAGKHHAMECVAGCLGVAMPEVLAVGDNLNDIEMLRMAGVGVAVGNALPAVQEAADWVAPCAAEDGVACALERFVL